MDLEASESVNRPNQEEWTGVRIVRDLVWGPEMNHLPDLAALLRDPSKINEIPPQAIPAILTQLAALHNALAARLLLTNENAAGHPEDRPLGIKEAAQRLGVSISWLYRRSSRLSFVVRMGRRLVFSLQGIERYIKQRAGRT